MIQVIKEVRKLEKSNYKKARYIRTLLDRKRIKSYVKNGFMAYDTEEYNEYRKNARVGRPIKINK